MSNRSETKEKLFKLRLALEFAIKEQNKDKINKLENEIKEVRKQIAFEEIENIERGKMK